ncbi:BCCT family transporter [Nocardiopsis changdeensis]|uniref:BCCT family transporter n=1 Tax=Nocardiopsis changdeensis TaxID=2831969 RepID=A0ABX8BTF0_9ACTN|nr:MULTISPECIES: BCCT family transporter [Nocardiopsis]QUX24028.1 BCCT family transporter [Nocardiopsis changdeensis]QYX34424.1 BCCT family transporter [Nocardiopsis sp. MT53]
MSGIVIIAFVVLGIVFTDPLLDAATATRDWIGTRLGWLYVLATTFFLGLALFLMFSRYGNIRLGPDDSRPEFGTVAWFAMLFTTGMGIGLVFWGVSEPIHHLHWPRTAAFLPGEDGAPHVEAAGEAMALSFFHWSFHPWAIYIALGVSLGYFTFRKGLPLRPASALYPLLGDRAFGWPGNLVDILAVFGTIFGLATSLGLGTLQIGGGIQHVFGIESNPLVHSVLIVVITGIALLSVLAGIDKGIRRLSVINLWLAIALMLIVFLLGPKLWIISITTTGLGEYLDNLVPWSLSFPSSLMDEQAASWTTTWSIFYWGWWISWAPFVGIFLARVSYGRTIREFVIGALFAPVVVSVLWFGVFGGSGLYYDLFEGGGLNALAEEDRAFRLIELLPLGQIAGVLVSVLLIIVVAVFFITSSDSGSLVVDMLTNGGDPNPLKAQRAFWAISEGAVTLVLLVLGGADALSALQAAAVVTGLPFAVILLFMCWGLAKALKDEPRRHGPKIVYEPEDQMPSYRPPGGR